MKICKEKQIEILDNAGADTIDCLDKLNGYEAIGTIEEFKVLKEKEKQFDRNIKMFNKIGLEIRNKAIDDAIGYVKQLIAELDVDECTKYGNKNADQQAKSYDTLMKYEIADSIENLLDNMEQLKS